MTARHIPTTLRIISKLDAHMTHGSLFSGIGGFDLAAQWMGWENKFHCEWNEFGQKVLHHYWPEAELFTDITKSDFKKYHGTIDIISGGFPCQPYSMAGKRLGKEDDRHLWPEMLRVIREVRPRWVVGENVFGLVNWNGGLVFNEVQSDLEAEGYEVQPYVLPAAAVNAPHRRDRVWFVAHAKDIRWNGRECKFREKINQDTTRFCQHRQERSQMGTELERHSKEWIAADTDLHGCNERNGEHEEQSGERGFDAQRDIEQSHVDGDAANTNKRPKGSSREGGILERSWSENNDEPGQWGGKAEQHIGRLNVQRDATDTMRSGRWENNREGESKFFDENGKIGAWDTFPTQSPICGRNDGISTGLDNITFSKWRNESIKAYGNAVVPQVVLQIFKTIQAYEDLIQNKPNP
jgi:DNA (cytosine-5)-methyltransferase 1